MHPLIPIASISPLFFCALYLYSFSCPMNHSAPHFPPLMQFTFWTLSPLFPKCPRSALFLHKPLCTLSASHTPLCSPSTLFVPLLLPFCPSTIGSSSPSVDPLPRFPPTNPSAHPFSLPSPPKNPSAQPLHTLHPFSYAPFCSPN